jgi:signal transduction histidine kinase
MTSLQARSIEQQLDRRLNTMADFISAAFIDRSLDTLALGQPLFQIPGSGWYWAVRDQEKELVATSPSLFDPLPDITPLPPDQKDGRQMFNILLPDGDTVLRYFEKRFTHRDEPFSVIVTARADDIVRDIRQFRQSVVLVLSGIALALIVTLWLIIAIGLKPLQHLRTSLHAVQKGQAQRLTGDYPAEIMPLVNDFNQVMDKNEAILIRARHHVGNLAHALKTPLTVLRNTIHELEEPTQYALLEPLKDMQKWIDHYLTKARQNAHLSQATTERLDLEKELASLIKVMKKVYADKDLNFVLQTPPPSHPQPVWPMRRSDGQDLLGNLLDNACKFAHQTITITLTTITGEETKQGFCVTIRDDGPGIVPDQLDRIINRGLKLDESRAGSGLGLSIVNELVEAYHGEIDFESSAGTGLSVRVLIPVP